MTVVTQAISEKKLQKQPLVPSDVEAAGHPDAPDSPQQSSPANGMNLRPTALLVRVNRSRAKNLQNLTTTCVLLGAVFVFCAGLLASFYWYQEYARYRRNYKGWCGIPYIEKMSPDEMERMVDMQPLFAQMKQEFASPTDTLYEEFDIDLEFGEYEKIDIPDFSKGRKGRYVHDFTKNKTAIVDLEEGRCFIMDLNRSQVLPPKDFLDKINKIESGYYEVNTEVIREQYSVVLPALNQNDRNSLGYYIYESCLEYPVYRLEKINRQSSIVKRSTHVAKRENTFIEFAGRNIARYEIPNLSSAPGVIDSSKH